MCVLYFYQSAGGYKEARISNTAFKYFVLCVNIPGIYKETIRTRGGQIAPARTKQHEGEEFTGMNERREGERKQRGIQGKSLEGREKGS